MQNLTLFFKTSTSEESFNFPKIDVTKEIVEDLITNLTKKPADKFDISYHYNEGKFILLSEEDYTKAKLYAFTNKIVEIYVFTEQAVKFVFMEDYRYKIPEQELNNPLNFGELMQQAQYKMGQNKLKQKSSQHKKAKKEKVGKKDKNNLRNAQKKQEIKIGEPNFIEETEQSTIFNSIILNSQQKKYKSISLKQQSFQNKITVKQINKEQAIDMPLQKPNNINPNQLCEKSQIFQIQQLSSDSDLQQPKEKPIQITVIANKQNKEFRSVDDLKQEIINQVLSRLPQYLKLECFKNKPQLRNKSPSVPSILPMCCNCQKILNSKEKKKWEKKLAQEERKKIQLPSQHLSLQLQQKTFGIKK